MNIDYNAIGEWLKSTVMGIIILGAIGAIAATISTRIILWILRLSFPKLLNKIFNLLFAPLLRKLFAPVFKRYMVSQIIADYIVQRSPAMVATNVIELSVGLVCASVLALCCVTSTIIYFIIRGPSISIGVFILTTFTFLAIYNWLFNVSAFYGAIDIYKGEDVDEFESATGEKSMSQLQLLSMAIDGKKIITRNARKAKEKPTPIEKPKATTDK